MTNGDSVSFHFHYHLDQGLPLQELLMISHVDKLYWEIFKEGLSHCHIGNHLFYFKIKLLCILVFVQKVKEVKYNNNIFKKGTRIYLKRWY